MGFLELCETLWVELRGFEHPRPPKSQRILGPTSHISASALAYPALAEQTRLTGLTWMIIREWGYPSGALAPTFSLRPKGTISAPLNHKSTVPAHSSRLHINDALSSSSQNEAAIAVRRVATRSLAVRLHHRTASAYSALKEVSRISGSSVLNVTGTPTARRSRIGCRSMPP